MARKQLLVFYSRNIAFDSAIGGLFFFSSRRRHTRLQGDWSSDVCSSDLASAALARRPSGSLVSPCTSSTIVASAEYRATAASAKPISPAACATPLEPVTSRSEEHTSELQSPCNLVCRLLLAKKNKQFEVT